MSHLAFRNVDQSTGVITEFHIGGAYDGWYVGVTEGIDGGPPNYTPLRVATSEEAEWFRRSFWSGGDGGGQAPTVQGFPPAIPGLWPIA